MSTLAFRFALIILVLKCSEIDGKHLVKRSLLEIKCFENGRFYRDPDRADNRTWTNSECSKYYLCLEGEVFEFRCSVGLLFDVNRQVCDMRQNVHNCDVTAEVQIPKPLLQAAGCAAGGLGCADGSCLPAEYFCDGSNDCPDASDEGWCDESHDPNAAPPCDPVVCRLPDCYCSKDGTRIPGELDVSTVPQMIVITFDDAVNFENWDLFTRQLFPAERKNPNGCPARATFFVSHGHTNYRHVQRLWNDGHEIAVHSITHRGPGEWWSKNATVEEWFDEMVGQANIINRFANVRMEDLRGMRAPFLRVGWNRQFLMLKEFGFVYDASIVAPFSSHPLWPYTLDYKLPHKCKASMQNCPSRSYPGVWEMVINPLAVGENTCITPDLCPPGLSPEEIYSMFTANFKRHYLTNRAPYGLYFHSSWFKKPEYLNAFKKFLDDMKKLPDVYFVTNTQAIEWMKHPTPRSQLNHFEPWLCKPRHFEPSELACHSPNTCKLQSRKLHQDGYMITCSECPKSYPWLRNEFGFD